MQSKVRPAERRGASASPAANGRAGYLARARSTMAGDEVDAEAPRGIGRQRREQVARAAAELEHRAPPATTKRPQRASIERW